MNARIKLLGFLKYKKAAKVLLDLVEELSCGAQIYHSKLVRAGSTRQSNSLLVGHTLLMWFERNKQKPMNVENLGKDLDLNHIVGATRNT
jgi:hypothetical protein